MNEKKTAEDLLVEMSVTMNNLCRFYDQKNESAIKATMDKVYELSHKGISHLTKLDELTEETAALRKENERLKEALKELIPIAGKHVVFLSSFKGWIEGDPNEKIPDWYAKLPGYETVIENAKKLTGQI